MNLIKKTKYGLMIYNNKDVWIGRSIEEYGEYSEAEVQLFRDTIKPGNCVLDIGANIGCHTLAFSRLVGPSGNVFAFEPEKTNYYTLSGNIAINNLTNVVAYQRAIGNKVDFIRVPEVDLEKTINFGGLSLQNDFSQVSNYVVPLVTIDAQSPTKVDFIKIDIEGMEKEALEGSVETIQKFKPLLYIEDDRKENHDEVLRFLKDQNYVVYKHNAPLFNPYNYFDNDKNVFLVEVNGNLMSIDSLNLFCHHKSVPCPVDITLFAMKPL